MSDTDSVNLFEQAAGALNSASPFLELFTLDATAIGGGISNWTPGPLNGGAVSFGGVTYQYLPIQADGFDYSGQGPLPQPTLKVSNVANIPMGLLIGYGDLLGAQVTRIRTFQRFLDGQPDANASYVTMADIYYVERKAYAADDYVQLELSSSLDLQGRKLPFRVVLQGSCTHTYRYWNPATSEFVQGTCPYTGSLYFDLSDTSQTNPALDNCARKLVSCNERFNPAGSTSTVPLPTRAFPGATVSSF